MPTSERLHTRTFLVAILAQLACGGALQAQRMTDDVHHAVDSRVGALLVVRRATYPTFEGRKGAVTALSVGANVRHDVLVRLDVPFAAIVEVRDASGTFRRVGEEPVLIATATAGAHELDVAWRMRGTAAGSAAPAISYVVSASEAH